VHLHKSFGALHHDVNAHTIGVDWSTNRVVLGSRAPDEGMALLY
jgi:hypothetical protein